MNAVITGATKGMGRAIVYQLASNQYNIGFCARNGAELKLMKEELEEIYPNQKFFCMPADFANQTDVKAFSDFVLENFKKIDVLVNNAGLFIPASFFDETETDLTLQMDVNLHAPYILCRTIGKRMKEEGAGHIFNICSIASLTPVVSAASYSVTKFALLGLTKVLRDELMPYNVKVTAILPGSTLTDSWSGTQISPDRFVRATDVAMAIVNCLKMSTGANVDEVIIRPVSGDI